MDILQLSRERFSARKYTEEPVSDADLDYVLETLRMAPSAVNKQPWKFVVVKSEAARLNLQQCYQRDWFRTAPLYLIGLRNTAENWVRGCDGKPHGDIDVAIATEHLCLAATERGLGTCWVCNFDVDKMRELFPYDGYEAVVIIPIGHIAPDCPHPAKNRKPLAEIVETL
ncbi:MAG: nitroreductase family protein [Bacteroidales bacterium]|nr:nitroreductase family protein [Bacteroidales bacterium]